jgi:hypothetical protein
VNTYLIRFNHNHNESGQVWRVFENGQEHLVQHVKILAPVYDRVTVENGVEKWNLCCHGYMTIDNNTATIRQHMMLPDFVLPSRANQTWSYSGIDSLELCLNKKHFESYPYDITYNYNSRGYRDSEWPEQLNELQSAIWCVGDSFTVGLGSPVEHTWPWILQQATQRRTINVSMDGASNMWIARKSLDIVDKIKPAQLVIQWSYISRREKIIGPLFDNLLDNSWQKFYKNIADPSWPPCTRHTIDQLPTEILEEIKSHGPWQPNITDEMRLIMTLNCTVEDDIKNTLDCIGLLSQVKSTQIVHSFIPKFVPKTHQGIVEPQIAGLIIPEIQQLDLARDGHHYDVLTSSRFVDQVMQLLT